MAEPERGLILWENDRLKFTRFFFPANHWNMIYKLYKLGEKSSISNLTGQISVNRVYCPEFWIPSRFPSTMSESPKVAFPFHIVPIDPHVGQSPPIIHGTLVLMTWNPMTLMVTSPVLLREISEPLMRQYLLHPVFAREIWRYGYESDKGVPQNWIVAVPFFQSTSQ